MTISDVAGLSAALQTSDGRFVVRGTQDGFVAEATMPDKLLHLYCAFKPLVGIAVLSLIDRYSLQADCPLPRLPFLRPRTAEWLSLRHPSVTLRNLLSHTAGLGQPSATLILLATESASDRALSLAESSGRREYSEYVAGWILDRVFRDLDVDLASVTEGLLAHLGPESNVAACSLPRARELRLAGWQLASPLYKMADGRNVPLVSETRDGRLARLSPAFDGLMTAEALLSFYSELSRTLRGHEVPAWPSPAVLREWLATADSGYDYVLRREVGFAAMLMTDISYLGGKAIGHSTGYTATVGLVDPARDLSMVVVDTQLAGQPEVERRRAAALQAVFELAGLRAT
ncbi:MAG: beta-lactamase family protein [Actinobacteria bacterium]|nr:beta-lactamase family protein [Actinomycetota bacterium]